MTGAEYAAAIAALGLTNAEYARGTRQGGGVYTRIIRDRVPTSEAWLVEQAKAIPALLDAIRAGGTTRKAGRPRKQEQAVE